MVGLCISDKQRRGCGRVGAARGFEMDFDFLYLTFVENYDGLKIGHLHDLKAEEIWMR